MEKWVNGFKSDMKMAARTVKSGWKTYSAIFVALFLIQMLFGLIGLSSQRSSSVERQAILDNYDSHVELTNLSDADHYYLVDVCARMQDPYFKVIAYRNEEGVHTTGIFFYEDAKDSLESFLLDFNDIIENGTVCTPTPLYTYDVEGIGESVRLAMIFMFCAAVSLVILTILNTIRINHFKFGYGIYMSFGADFRRLIRLTVCETLFVLLLTYLPAMVVSFVVITVLSVMAGGGVFFAWMPFVWAFLIPIAVAVLATVMPIRVLTLRRPTQVMLAEDNSNQVLSPRRSRWLCGRSFPRIPEVISLLRFSVYGLKLTGAVTLFALLFTGGIYVVSFYDQTLDHPMPQYTVTLESADDAFAQKMENVPGITVLNGAKTQAESKFSHVLFEKDAVNDKTYFADYQGKLATEKVVYRPADEGLPAALHTHYGYEVTGDPDQILKDENSVILSDSIASERVLDIEVGDTVCVALYGGQSERYNPYAIYSEEELLKVHLENHTFTYRAFTVAAVIHNEPDRTGLCVYLPSAVYADLTDDATVSWSVYADPGLTDEEFAAADDALRSLVSDHYTATMQDHETRMWSSLAYSHNYTAVYTAVFLLVLALVPLVWFFSLVLFNQKRWVELDVYRAMGATGRELKRIFMMDGAVYAVAGGLFYAILAPICTYYLRKVLVSEAFFSFVLQSYADKPVYMQPTPSLWAYICGVLLTAASALMACYLSYLLYRKRASDHISENFSEED